MSTDPPPPAAARPPTAKPRFRFHPHTWTIWLMATPLLMGAALFFDFFPRLGPPAFSFPDQVTDEPVYNLGWPIVTSLYAPQIGFRLGPLGWSTFLAKLLLYAACTGIVWAWRHAVKDTSSESGGAAPSPPTRSVSEGSA